METIKNKVERYIKNNNMLCDKDTVVAGVSGGADSMCMLKLLLELRDSYHLMLKVVHVNHMIREEAAQDADYVRSFCEQYAIPFYLFEKDIEVLAKSRRLSTEEAGRVYRYEVFEQVASETAGSKIAVAHNAGDNAETVLFHLFRGSSLRGTSGIAPVRSSIIRPILCLDRTEIEEYLQSEKVAYCHDKTNDSDDYTRNKIRHHIIEYAEKEICEGAARHLSEFAGRMRQMQEYLDKTAKAVYDRALVAESGQRIELSIDILKEYDPFLIKSVCNIAFDGLTESSKDITSHHYDKVLEIMMADKNAQYYLPYDMRVRKSYDRLVLEVPEPTGGEDRLDKEYQIPVPGSVDVVGYGLISTRILTDYSKLDYENNPQKSYTKWLDYDKISECITLRTRQDQDKIILDEKGHSKKLGRYMMDQKIPVWERDSYYLLADGNVVIWLPGYRMGANYKVSADTTRVLEIKIIRYDQEV